MSKIKDLPRVERPREKLERYGASKLTTAELLAVILRTGTKNLNVCELAKKIVRKFESDLVNASLADLKNIYGLGTTKALEIIACFELGKRFLKDKKSVLILSPKDVWLNLRDIRDNKKEHFVVFFLDARSQEIQREIISVGTLNANLIHPREVFEPAVRCLCAQIIIAHNHPSDDTKPSQEDMEVTKSLVEAGRILGIEIVDHVIVSRNSFLSLKCEGLL